MSDWTTDTGIHKNRLLTDSMASCIQSDWERILIVDDVQRNLDAMTTLLAEPDRVLLTAKSGMEALKLLQTTPVDLILLDVQMPGVTGFDTAELIRARPSLHEIPIIFVSAAATNDEYVSKGFAAGAYDYIVKPVQAEVLENKVKIFLELYRSRKQARQYATCLNAIVSASPSGYVAFNDVGNLMLANSTFLKMFGMDMAGLKNMSEKDFEKSLLSTGSYRSGKSVNTTWNGKVYESAEKTGEQKVFVRNDQVMSDEVGCVIGKVLSFLDISKEDELAQAQRNFLSTAAHEMRTPLASILGYSELLLSRDYDKDGRDDLINVIHRQSNHLGSMVSDLMDLSLLESASGMAMDWESTSLSELVMTGIETGSTHESRQRVDVIRGEIDLEVTCDSPKASAAIRNVISNSLKYSDAGTRVSIRMLNKVEDDEDFFGVNVLDEGVGMSPGELDKIFDRFFRAESVRSKAGTGLGMSYVQQVMALHGGSVEIASSLGEGMSVTLWFPQTPKSSGL